MTISLNYISDSLWNIKKVLMDKYGVAVADREIAPLLWYINTGRAPVSFLKLLIAAKPYLVAHRLHAGGSDDEIIARVKTCIGFKG